MPTVLQFRRGTTSQNNAFTGSTGELTINTETGSLRVHDGVLAGGSELLKIDGTNLPAISGDTDIVNKLYVDTAVSNLLDSAPGTLDTLNELAAALGDDPNFATTVTNSLATKANSADLATVATTGSYTDLTDKPDTEQNYNIITAAETTLDANKKYIILQLGSNYYADMISWNIGDYIEVLVGTGTPTSGSGDINISNDIGGMPGYYFTGVGSNVISPGDHVIFIKVKNNFSSSDIIMRNISTGTITELDYFNI